MSGIITLEDVILALPQTHRDVVATLRVNYMDLQRQKTELEAELTFTKQRMEELEHELTAAHQQPVSIPAPQMNLQELIAGLKSQHQAAIESVRRKTTEAIHQIDDSSFDPLSALHSSVTKSIRPNPKNFEHVDLFQLRETLTQENYAPSSPLQAPLITEFITQIDGVRSCMKDQRYGHLYYDPIKSDLLRRMFDVCKNVEQKIGTTSHLQLPSQSVVVEKDPNLTEATLLRRKEFAAHVQRIEQCGEVFQRAIKDISHLNDSLSVAESLPHFLNEFDFVMQQMTNDIENCQRNEVVLVEAGSLHIENITSHRKSLQELAASQVTEIDSKSHEVDAWFAEMLKLLELCEEGFRTVMALTQQHSKTQIEIATCDHRVTEMRKSVEHEVQRQQKFLEGAKFSLFLCGKSKDLYKRLFLNIEESVKSRKEYCERIKQTSQEQLYTMAEVLHDHVTKWQSSDNMALRNDQAQLENANRSLMALVHQPAEMEKMMVTIRDVTTQISNSKARLAQAGHDLASIRQLLARYSTLSFLKRDTNFLSIHETMEKTSKLKDKLDEAVQRIKFVSEMLVEVSDPDTRQEYLVHQCLEALKTSVSEMNDLIAAKAKMDDFDETYRNSTSTKIKRHKRLISHFLAEIKEGNNDIATIEPAIELNVVSLIEGIDTILATLTGVTEPGREGLGFRQGFTPPMFGAVPHAILNPDGSITGGAINQGSATTASEPEQRAHHVFARFSAKLKVTRDMHHCMKPGGAGLELSNTSALGSVGFRLGSGVHSFSIRLLSNCTRLLVGVADWNLPLDGYCNSLKYNGCWYLHLGNGTLWAPELRIERKPFTYEAVGATNDSILKVVVDTNSRTISYVWNDLNLGVAFRNVTMTRTLYPAFEVFNNNCAFEFCHNAPAPGESSFGGGEPGTEKR